MERTLTINHYSTMHFSIRFLSSQTVSIILTVLITFSALPSHAQDPDPFSYASRLQPSAEAWQMARHGEISPDLFTGAMAWSLPLYTYKDEDFTIPVSLNYRFDGCRPAQPSGTVGYGWSLNCGGVITRQVVGLPDDYVRQVVYVDTDGEQHESWEVGFYYAAIDHGFIPATSLGSTRTIVEGDDYTEVEQNDFYPFGKRIADNTLPTTATNRWRFSGKEIQTLGGINLIDFGARLYDDFSGRWKTQDVLTEKYFGLSPYGYCAGNPMNLIDYMGLDIWELDEEGRIASYRRDTSIDAVYLVERDNDGNYIRKTISDSNGNMIEVGVCFDYGTIESVRSITFSPDNKTVDSYDVYQIRGDDNGRALFELLSKAIAPKGIEAGFVTCGLEGSNGLDFVSTSHSLPLTLPDKRIKAQEFSLPYLLQGQLLNGYTIREITHSHPFTRIVSNDDREFVNAINDYLKKSNKAIPKYYLWHVDSGKYVGL